MPPNSGQLTFPDIPSTCGYPLLTREFADMGIGYGPDAESRENGLWTAPSRTRRRIGVRGGLASPMAQRPGTVGLRSLGEGDFEVGEVEFWGAGEWIGL